MQLLRGILFPKSLTTSPGFDQDLILTIYLPVMVCLQSHCLSCPVSQSIGVVWSYSFTPMIGI